MKFIEWLKGRVHPSLADMIEYEYQIYLEEEE